MKTLRLVLALCAVLACTSAAASVVKAPSHATAVAVYDAPGQYRVVTTWTVAASDIDSVSVLSGGLGNDGAGFTHRYGRAVVADTMFFTAKPGQSGTSSTCVTFIRRGLGSTCGTATWGFTVPDSPPAAPAGVSSTATLQ